MVALANRSTFPQQIDAFPELFDLPPSLVASAKRYQELKIKPTLNATEQAELNNLTTTLGSYIITPETWNKLGDSIVNMEQFIKDEVDGYIQAKQAEWADYVKDFHYVGIHSTSTVYEFQNMVKSNGDLYLALKDVPTGIAITDTAYWQKISTKGDKGDVGLNAYYKGNYSTTATYAIGDAVSYNGFIYYCRQATTAGITPTNGTYWFLWDRQIISATQPSTTQQGLLWVKLQD